MHAYASAEIHLARRMHAYPSAEIHLTRRVHAYPSAEIQLARRNADRRGMIALFLDIFSGFGSRNRLPRKVK